MLTDPIPKGERSRERRARADHGALMHKYEIILCWSNEDQASVAKAPELPGCMAHGDDHETALGNIKHAMQFWIDRARGWDGSGRNPRAGACCRLDWCQTRPRPTWHHTRGARR